MAQIPEFSALPPLAQSLVQQGYTFDVAIAAAVQQQQDAAAAAQGDAGVLVATAKAPVTAPKVVDHRMGRTPGPNQLPQFSALSPVAQQHVVDRGFSFAMAKQIEADIAASANPTIARWQRWNSD